MTVMYSFCLWFPVRAGAIIVALTCAGESLACLIAALIGLHRQEATITQIEDWLENYDFYILGDFLNDMKTSPDKYLNAFVAALSIHLLSCALLLFGAFKCYVWLIYPFVGLDFLRVGSLSVLLIIVLLIIKSNTITLGSVIGVSISGGFVMLYLWYQWFCVVSLCQIIREVRRMEGSENNVAVPVLQSHSFNSKIGTTTNYGPIYTKATFGTRNFSSDDYYGLPSPNN